MERQPAWDPSPVILFEAVTPSAMSAVIVRSALPAPGMRTGS